MGTDFHRSRIVVKARKNRRCTYCGRPITKGTQYIDGAHFTDAEFCSYRCCTKCAKENYPWIVRQATNYLKLCNTETLRRLGL